MILSKLATYNLCLQNARIACRDENNCRIIISTSSVVYACTYLTTWLCTDFTAMCLAIHKYEYS